MAPPKMAAAVVASLYLFVVVVVTARSAGAASCAHYGAGGRAAAGRRSGGGGGGGGARAVQGVFVFGSSLVDNGNNDFLNGSGVRADYLPYGVDFPLGPSGRFSNGRNAVDVLGQLLRLPGRGLVPPFADPATTGRAALHGVNFASGGSGILDRTGHHTGEVMSLRQQITNFEAVTLPDLRAQLTSSARMNGRDFFHRCYLPKSLFVIGTGGNDYLLNYFRPRKGGGGGEAGPTVSEFTVTLVAKLSGHLHRLYGLGARKFVIFSIQPMGCTPVVLRQRTTVAAPPTVNATAGAAAGCVEVVNDAALLFNSELRLLVDSARRRMPGASFSLVNSYKIIMDMLDHPTKHGIRETGRACCEVQSRESAGVLCQRGGPICRDRTKYVFFDGLHPTDVVNARVARRGYRSGSPEEAYPINVKRLAAL